MNLPDMDVLTASAARFLIDGDEQDAARMLLACTLDIKASGDSWYSREEEKTVYAYHVVLTGPRVAYDVLNDDDNMLGQQIYAALAAVLPWDVVVTRFTPRAELVDIDPDWRTELLEIARGLQINNQGTDYGANRRGLTWNNMKFRSRSETKIARALDEAGTFFMPNCLARLGQKSNRRNREPDFLVCYEQKWGILEVDGEPFHPPSRTTQEQERDRLFKLHGIRVVEHFDASRCYRDPDGVVAEFLRLLRENG